MKIDFLIFVMCDPLLSTSLVPLKALEPILKNHVTKHLQHLAKGKLAQP